MPFQTAVYSNQGIGLPGTRYDASPMRAISYLIQSASAAYNIVGATAYTITSDGIAQAGSGGAGGFAGILVNPEIQAFFGVSNISLSPSMVINNGVVAPCSTMGRFIVTLPAAAVLNSPVIYDNTTGALSTIAPNAALPTGKSFANAIVIQDTVTAGGSAIIEISPVLVVPVP